MPELRVLKPLTYMGRIFKEGERVLVEDEKHVEQILKEDLAELESKVKGKPQAKSGDSGDSGDGA